MTNLPRRPIEPLAPAPESFDRVFGNARRRRRRKLAAASSTMTVALVAVVSFAMGASLHRPVPIDPAGHSKGPVSQSPQTPGPTSSTSEQPKASRSGETKANSVPITWLHGRVVDASGQGIAGLYVQPGRSFQPTFGFAGRGVVRTDAQGNFRVVCPHAPVLLSTWRINQNYADNAAGGSWGATFVGSSNGSPVVPPCGSHLVTTTLSAGATVTGQLLATGTCQPDDVYNVWLWLGGEHNTTIRLAAVHVGDTFSYSGLPAGTHTIGVRGQTKDVAVVAGSTVSADVDFDCDATTEEPTESPDPSSSPPTESPEAQGTPSPTPTPTIS